jgi:alpha-tubulin suppressor-like RCC1 family protein
MSKRGWRQRGAARGRTSSQRGAERRRPSSRCGAAWRLAAAVVAAAAAAAVAVPAMTSGSALAAGSATAAVRTRADGGAGPRTGAAFGSLDAWGSNQLGQLGDGTTTNQDAPVLTQLAEGTFVTSARSGCDGSIALTRSRQVLDWGLGNAGQLGNGARKNSLVPVRVKLPPGTKTSAVREGCDFSLALTAGGKVFTWGIDPASAVPAVAAPGRALPVQVRFPAGVRVTGISAGTSFGLAVTASGRVYAWGRNDNGQFGNGRHGPGTDSPVRVHLPVGTKVTAVAAGDDHSLALTSTGTVLAWGNQADGALGNGRVRGNATVPVRTKLPDGTRVRGLFAGADDGYALTSAGTVLAWGENFDGKLGDGTTTNRPTPVHVMLPPGTKPTAIGAGADFALALTSDHRVLAWGVGFDGQLGNGTGDGSLVPVWVQLQDALSVGSGPSAESGLAIIEPVN